MIVDKLLALLGLAQRAGMLAAGSASVRALITKKKVKLLIVAEDAALATKKDFLTLADTNSVPLIEISSKRELGVALGKTPKAVVAVLDTNIAKRVQELMAAGNA